jgi:serine/threonine protein kinase
LLDLSHTQLYDVPTGKVYAHAVVLTYVSKAFARKLVHLPGPDREEVDNEIRAIMKLCVKRAHKNIVSVLKLGELPNSSYYFIDMELCDLNLAVYIHRTDVPNPSESLPYFMKDASSHHKALQIWNIMKQIAGGIKYIHGQDLVHRDVKPANGTSLLQKLLILV